MTAAAGVALPPGTVLAPFSPDQVASLNHYQTCGVMHPFTCGNRSSHHVLVATVQGLHCKDCDYKQNWAWLWMANWAWHELYLRQEQRQRG